MLEALVIAGIVAASTGCAALLYAVKAAEDNVIAGGAAVLLAGLLWLPVTRNWSPRAHLCWASSTFLFVVYLAFALERPAALDSALGGGRTLSLSGRIGPATRESA